MDGEKKPLKLSFHELPKPPSLPSDTASLASPAISLSGSSSSPFFPGGSGSSSSLNAASSTTSSSSAPANAASSTLHSAATPAPGSPASAAAGSGSPMGQSSGRATLTLKPRTPSVRRTDSNSFLSRESLTDLSKLRQLQRPTRQSHNPALQRHHAFIAIDFPPVYGSVCGFCAGDISAEKQFFMCQRCTLSLHADCVDKRESGICENHADLTSFEIIEAGIAEAMQDKVNKINQLNALISESSSALDAVNKKLDQHQDPPKMLVEEWKLHEKKLKKFRNEKGILESLIFVEVGDMSDEMRRYSMLDEPEEEPTKEGKASFAKGFKDKVKLVLS